MSALIECACGNPIGKEVIIHGIVLFHAGGGIWRELHGNCVQCGEKFHWSLRDKQLQQVIMRKKIYHPTRKKMCDATEDTTSM